MDDERFFVVKISIIVPIYNAEKYLEQCLDSIRKQTLKDIEIICVDDGSTDRSPEIIDRFAGKDRRFVVIHKENAGNGHTMNQGLHVASGEYIGCVEADDYIEKNMYEKLYMYSNEGSVDIVKCNFWNCYEKEDGSVEKIVNQERMGIPVKSSPFTIRECPEFLFGHPSIWSAIYKKEIIDENNIVFKEEKGGSWVDNPFFFETITCAKSIMWVNRPFYNYRTEVEGSSSNGYDFNIPFNRMIDNLDVLEKRKSCDEELLKSTYARALMYLMGAVKESNYEGREEEFLENAKKMLDCLNPTVIKEDFNNSDQRNYYKYDSPINTLYKNKKKILIYNWLPFDNPKGYGGGVTIYCRNLIESIIENRPDVEVYFLSSGWAYDVSEKECYVRKIPNVFDERCNSYEIVNSPIPAPQDMLFKNPSLAFKNEVLKNVVDGFIEMCGGFEVIHFNNMEGLSFDVFELKEKYKDTRFVYSLHNYVPMCMTGFYYNRAKHINCSPDCSASDCDRCIDRSYLKDYENEMLARGLVNKKKNYSDEYKYEWSDTFKFDQLNICKDASEYVEFKNKASLYLNRYMDTILAVSERVYEIAIDNHIDESKLEVCYIGTRVADFQIGHSNCEVDDVFKICYLGSNLEYEEKGYPFLLDALEAMDNEYAEKVELILTTTTSGKDNEITNRLKKFGKVRIIHGYTHKELYKILNGVNLGIIPVLWEDNLPQIAIEMVAFGVPVLSSNAGGASELTCSDRFKFESGNTKDLLDKLYAILDDTSLLQEFWDNHKGLCTRKEHFDQIERIYNLPAPEEVVLSARDVAKLIDERDFLYQNFESDMGLDECKKQIKKLEDEIDAITEERDDLSWRLSETWKSKSFKIGRAITALPRAMRMSKK